MPTIEAEKPVQYTTPEEMEKYEALLEKNFITKGKKDGTFHRITHMFPEFKAATGEDVVTVSEPGQPEVMAIKAIYKVHVEHFKMVGKGKEQTKQVLGNRTMTAKSFLEQHESAPLI